MLDGVKESLLDIRKNLQKNLIQTVVASQSRTATETRKQVVKQMEKTKLEGLKAVSASYLDSFSTSAEGEWVKQAKQTFKQTTAELDTF